MSGHVSGKRGRTLVFYISAVAFEHQLSISARSALLPACMPSSARGIRAAVEHQCLSAFLPACMPSQLAPTHSGAFERVGLSPGDSG
eukprot:10382520-Alexandrium_andersonii.AAC.1